MPMETMTIKINLSSANVKTVIEGGVMTIVIENNSDVSPIVMECGVTEQKHEVVASGAIEEVRKVKVVYDEDTSDDESDMESDDEKEERRSVLVWDIKTLINKIDSGMCANEYRNYFRNERMDAIGFEFNCCVEAIEKHIESHRKIEDKDMERDIEYGHLAREGAVCDTDDSDDSDDEDKDMERDIEYGHLAREGAAWLEESENSIVKPCEPPMPTQQQRPKKIKCKYLPIVPLPPMEYFKPSARDEEIWRMVNEA
jgi:hypothetical protein